jgi:adenine-specific DNA-methyltransferase
VYGKSESKRRLIAPTIDKAKKAAMGQYMTPEKTASFAAGMFPRGRKGKCRLLDAGAGLGALSTAFLDRWEKGHFGFKSVSLIAFEIDPALRVHLEECLNGMDLGKPFDFEIDGRDFIERAALMILEGGTKFTDGFMNPPYKKIGTHSQHRNILRKVGIETVNLYSAFVALGVQLLEIGGYLVAIIPRSFCNGPYYRPFREFVLARCAIRAIHLFDARNKAFSDDEVLQENVIIMFERGAAQGNVEISISTDDTFMDIRRHHHPFGSVVKPNDKDLVIHIPTTSEPSALDLSSSIRFSLEDIGISISTGPVVDFRLKELLRDEVSDGTVPLLYPTHFEGDRVRWPKLGGKKANAIVLNSKSERWLYPNGFYCVVRRFSSKEERRRIVASVVRPDDFPGFESLGFENHLNVFHEGKKGLPEDLAIGLAVYLNSTAVDDEFRRFNGHTQVNATDMKKMKYPARNALLELGKWARKQNAALSQESIDEQFERLAA